MFVVYRSSGEKQTSVFTEGQYIGHSSDSKERNSVSPAFTYIRYFSIMYVLLNVICD